MIASERVRSNVGPRFMSGNGHRSPANATRLGLFRPNNDSLRERLVSELIVCRISGGVGSLDCVTVPGGETRGCASFASDSAATFPGAGQQWCFGFNYGCTQGLRSWDQISGPSQQSLYWRNTDQYDTAKQERPKKGNLCKVKRESERTPGLGIKGNE